MKAYRIMEDIVRSVKITKDTSKKEQNIYNYQFLLNFLTKSTKERAAFLQENFMLIENYEEFINNIVLPILRGTDDEFNNKKSKLRSS